MKKPAGKDQKNLADLEKKIDSAHLAAEAHEAEIKSLRGELARLNARIDAAEAEERGKTLWKRLFGKSRT